MTVVSYCSSGSSGIQCVSSLYLRSCALCDLREATPESNRARDPSGTLVFSRRDRSKKWIQSPDGRGHGKSRSHLVVVVGDNAGCESAAVSEGSVLPMDERSAYP